MKIGIILHPFGEKHPGGLPRVIFGWAENLIRFAPENSFIIYLKEECKQMPILPDGNVEFHVLGGGRFWMDKLASAPKSDVYLFNTPVLPFFTKLKGAIVIAQDFPYKYLPARSIKEFFKRKFVEWYHSRSFRRAAHIIAISDYTKKDVIRFFGIPESKVTTIYPDYKRICDIFLPDPVPLPERFFFFAATIKERKNVFTIVRAFIKLLDRRPDLNHHLVLGGKAEGSYYESIMKFIRENKREDRIQFLGHLTERQLSYIYPKADALVFPSIVEGTGLPVLEAMSCGTPVITSDICGPSELGAEGSAILVHPEDSDEMSEAMEQIATDDNLRQELSFSGKKRSDLFSWDKIPDHLPVKKFLAIAEKIVG